VQLCQHRLLPHSKTATEQSDNNMLKTLFKRRQSNNQPAHAAKGYNQPAVRCGQMAVPATAIAIQQDSDSNKMATPGGKNNRQQ